MSAMKEMVGGLVSNLLGLPFYKTYNWFLSVNTLYGVQASTATECINFSAGMS